MRENICAHEQLHWVGRQTAPIRAFDLAQSSSLAPVESVNDSQADARRALNLLQSQPERRSELNAINHLTKRTAYRIIKAKIQNKKRPIRVIVEDKMGVRKMKEKCKDAARMRREKERAEFVELSKLLPLPSSTTCQLDKASIIRLTSSYLKMRSAFPQGLGANWGYATTRSVRSNVKQTQILPNPSHNLTNQLQQVRELGSLILQTLEGFVFALHPDGKIMYISETASVHLGLPQIDLTGSSVLEYIHPSDHSDLYETLTLTDSDRSQIELIEAKSPDSIDVCELGRSFCIRMRCVLPKRNAGLVSGGYKAIHCSGYLKVKRRSPDEQVKSKDDKRIISGQSSSNYLRSQVESSSRWESYTLVAVGHSLLSSAATEVKLSSNSFMFRANLDLTIHYIEPIVMKILGFEQFEMNGLSLYQFVHAADCSSLEKSHKTLLAKGQVVTKYYRLMRKDGGSVLIQSYVTLINNPRSTPKPQHLIGYCLVLAEDRTDSSCAIQEPVMCQTAIHRPAMSISNQSQPDPTESDNLPGACCNHSFNSSGIERNDQSIDRLEQLQRNRMVMMKRTKKSRSNETSNNKAKPKSQFNTKILASQIGQSSSLDLVDNVTHSSHKIYEPIARHPNYAPVKLLSTHQQSHQPVSRTQSAGRGSRYFYSNRRISDDTCSIVSSAASSIASSNSNYTSEYSLYSTAEAASTEDCNNSAQGFSNVQYPNQQQLIDPNSNHQSNNHDKFNFKGLSHHMLFEEIHPMATESISLINGCGHQMAWSDMQRASNMCDFLASDGSQYSQSIESCKQEYSYSKVDNIYSYNQNQYQTTGSESSSHKFVTYETHRWQNETYGTNS